MFHLTGSLLALAVVLSFVWALLGYLLAENDRKTLGRTPWGLPSGVWALLFWLLSLIPGLVLYLIAHRLGVRRAHQARALDDPSATGSPARPAMAAARQPSVAEQFPSYPQPANLRPQAPVEPEVVSGAGPHSPPAWHPDPSGRFHYRWWDGDEWTSQVATDGQHLVDTSTDQRIGPY